MVKIYLSRHGESLYNLENRIGGNSDLSSNGKKYSKLLRDFFENHDIKLIFTSNLIRTINTASSIDKKKTIIKDLNEINAGIAEDLTYDEFKSKYPNEFIKRKKDKLNYRYPKGESYIDLQKRLLPVIETLKNQQDNILVVAHQAVLRVIYAYLTGKNISEIPYISIPLHTVICIDSNDEEIFKLL